MSSRNFRRFGFGSGPGVEYARGRARVRSVPTPIEELEGRSPILPLLGFVVPAAGAPMALLPAMRWRPNPNNGHPTEVGRNGVVSGGMQDHAAIRRRIDRLGCDMREADMDSADFANLLAEMNFLLDELNKIILIIKIDSQTYFYLTQARVHRPTIGNDRPTTDRERPQTDYKGFIVCSNLGFSLKIEDEEGGKRLL
jgi:hypothetical protein